MKYMIMTYATQADYDAMAGLGGASTSWTNDDLAAMGEFMGRLNAELAAGGELIETRALAAPVHTRRLRSLGGVPVVSDGPYAETQEVLAGYWIVECESFDRATQIAARLSECPAPEDVQARACADVRPIQEHMGDEPI